MRSMRFVLAGAAAAILALGAGIGTAKAEPVKIRLSYVVPVANWAPILLEKKDLMTHLGKSYTFEAVHFRGTPPMITALAAGELEIADFAYSSFALAVENAGMKDLKVIADEFQDGVPGYYTDEFFVLNDSPIKKVEDLKGKIVATNAAGSGIDIAQRAMLVKHHLDLKRDVTFVEGAFPNMKALLFEHKVDMIPGVLPFSLDPGLREKAHPLFTQKEAVGRTQMIVWAAREGFIKAHRAALVDFMEDALKVERWYLDPKNHEAAVAIAAKVTKHPAKVFASWLFKKDGQKGDYYRDPNGKPDLEALAANIKLQHDLGFIKSTIDVPQHADLSIVEEAAKRLK
jgi:NitT/TauT family transport system substrate-binding protein